MRAVVFSGTTEGRIFSRQLAQLGADVLVSVATPLGSEEQGSFAGITVHCGRLTPDEMAALVQGADLCVDATHPYAVDATRNIRTACRTAALASEPYLVTLDEGKWNGRDTYTKWSGSPIGFGRQIQADDGAQRIFRVVCPILFIACLLFSVMSSVGRERPQDILWCLSATLAAASSFSGALCFGTPWHKLSRRLSKSGAAIAGWDAVTSTGAGSGILLTDADLFPPGCVSLNGIKVFGDFSVDKVVSATATLIRDSGSGLDKIFHDLLRSQGCVYRRAQDLCCYEGGAGALIRGEQVLVARSTIPVTAGCSKPESCPG